MPPILKSPVDQEVFPITHEFWVDESDNPQYKDFYTVFDNHHPGVDFGLPEGTKISASLPGIVVRHEFHPGMGNVVAIRLGNIYSLYAHLSQVLVNLSDLISEGQLIALSGNTGQATTAPHLHFELRDLRETDLKKMVFEPKFNQIVKLYQPSFIYKINNDNQPKTFQILAKRYFGAESFSAFLRTNNPLFEKYQLTDILPHGESLLIPSP